MEKAKSTECKRKEWGQAKSTGGGRKDGKAKKDKVQEEGGDGGGKEDGRKDREGEESE